MFLIISFEVRLVEGENEHFLSVKLVHCPCLENRLLVCALVVCEEFNTEPFQLSIGSQDNRLSSQNITVNLFNQMIRGSKPIIILPLCKIEVFVVDFCNTERILLGPIIFLSWILVIVLVVVLIVRRSYFFGWLSRKLLELFKFKNEGTFL